MADYKITELVAYTSPVNTDVLPIVDITTSTTKKITIASLFTSPTFVTPVIGVATGTSLDLGTTTLYGSRAITVDTGGVLNIDIGSASGDDFTVDTSKLVVEGDTGNVGIGTTGPGALLHVQKDQNAVTRSLIQNATSGTGAYAQLVIGASNGTGSTYGDLSYFSAGYTTNGFFEASTVVLESATTGGLNLVASNASGDIRFGTGGYADASERVRITSAGNVGIGTTSPTNILSLSGQAARIIWTERNVTAATAGQNLTLRVGGAVVGGTNLGGGSLILAGGISTGTGTSDVQIQTCPAGASGTADNTLTTIIQATGNALGFFGHAVAIQQAYTAISDPPTQAQVTAIRDALVNLGLMASS